MHQHNKPARDAPNTESEDLSMPNERPPPLLDEINEAYVDASKRLEVGVAITQHIRWLEREGRSHHVTEFIERTRYDLNKTAEDRKKTDEDRKRSERRKTIFLIGKVGLAALLAKSRLLPRPPME